ncbi:MAG: hypothetical protein VKJ04_12025 [Vampirovibrionales bacterium]|nr:hypothetical protein [Vampirovibrionales bacterium]
MMASVNPQENKVGTDRRPYPYHERPEPLLIMDELESALLHHGWPIPCSPYYIVHHQKILEIVDRLRVSLQEEMDERFLHSFGPAFENS